MIGLLVGRRGPPYGRRAVAALSLRGPALAPYWPRVAEASVGLSPLHELQLRSTESPGRL